MLEQAFLSYLAELPFPVLFGLIVLGCAAFASFTYKGL